jgi:glycine cleavage system H protein
MESIKAVPDLYAPLSGTIVEIDVALSDGPRTVDEDPYEQVGS